MSKRGIGLLLILTSVIALGALLQDYRFDTLLRTERAATTALDGDVSDARQSIVALAAAQGAYFADGQGPTEWLSRVTTLEDAIDATIARRRTAASDADAIALYDAAADALTHFRTIDAQIRAALGQGDRTGAGNLVFRDSALAGRKIADSIEAARDRDRHAIDAGMARLVQLRIAMNGVALLFALAVALYFGRFITVMSVGNAPTTAQMLKDLPPPVKAGAATAHATAASPAIAIVAAPHVQPAHTGASHASPSASLATAAELCVDLSRVVDASDVPALLERAATLLDARGIMIWAVDGDGARLRPALSHGYGDKVLKKLRPLQIDADNVTSLAFRSLQPQSMNGASPNDPAAIAIPLLTGTGCVGVMAAELRHNRPHIDLLPVARILGAQFSTLVAVPEEPGLRSAHA